MPVCNACHALVAPGTGSGFCPLCGTELQPLPEGFAQGASKAAGSPTPGEGPAQDAPPANFPCPPGNAYPDLSQAAARYNLMLRLLVFLSALGAGITVMVNLLAGPGFLWSVIVIACLLYLWLTIPPLLRRGVNYAKRTVFQVLFTSALVVLLDLLTGYTGWSVSFVVPSLLCAGIASIGLLIIFNRTNWAQYVLYLVLMGVFAFVPLVLYLTGLAYNMVMVIITAGFGLASLLVTLVFGDRSVKSEFRRRFHF